MLSYVPSLTLLDLKAAIICQPLIVSPETIVLNAIAQMNKVRSDDASGEKRLYCADAKTVSMRDSQLRELNRIAPSRCVLVLENDRLTGIFTEQDVLRLSLQQQPLDRLSMREVMTAPVVTLLDKAFTDLLAASYLLQQYGVGYLPIVDEQNRPVGLLNRESLQLAIAIQQSIAYQQLQAELSERNRTEAMMQEQLTDLMAWCDRYELAAQAIGQMLYEYDCVHDVMTWDGKAERILGYPTAALPTSLSKWMTWIHPADQTKFSLSMAPSQVHEAPICLQYRVQHQAGHYLWVEHRGQWLMNDRGEAIGVVGILMDISNRQHVEEERQQAQLALQESEAKHRAVLAAIPDLMFRVGADGVYRGFVTTHREVDCLSSDIDPVGRSLVDLLPAQLAEQHFYYLQQALQTDELQVYEQTIQVGDRCQDEEVRVIKSGEDEVLFMIRDITSRKRTEAALKQSELTNRTIIQTMPDLLIQMDRQGRYSYMVGGSAVHIKYPASPSTEPELYNVLPPDLAEQRLYYANQALESGNVQVYEQVFPVEGDLHYEEVRIAPLNSQEVLIIIRDITDRKRTEAALQSLVESTAAVTGKDFFAALAQHLMLALKVQHVLVTKLVGDHLQTLAYWKEGTSQSEITFALADAPCCAAALEHGRFYCATGLQQRFANYPLIQSLQSDSYLGIPLTSMNGQRLGNLCVLDSKPMEDIRWAEAFLRIFAVRAAAELERQQATEALEQLNQDLEVRVEQRTEALRTSEANLSAIFNQAAVGINQAAPGGQYLKVNQKLCDILGYTQEELLRKTFRDVCHPEDVHKGEEERQRLYAGAIEFFSIEKRCLHKNGNIVWINLTVSLVRKPSGEPDYSIGVVEDITDRKRTEEALRYSEEQFRTVFDHAPIAICLARVDNYRIFRVNAAHRQLLGYSDAELSRMSFTDFTHPEDIEQDVKQVEQMVSGEISGFQMEKRLIRKTGDVILTNMVVALIRDREGSPLYSMAMIEDITKRRQTELEIIHNRDLREAIFNGSTDAIFLVDVNTHLTIDCNRRAIELFEATSKDELVNIEGNTLQRNPFTQAELAVIAQEIAEKGVWSHEVEYSTRKGNLFWGNLAVKQISIAGQMMNLVRVTDISKRKQTEKLLNAQQDFLRRLIDTVPNLIFVKDWEGRFTLVNQATANVYHSTIEALMGKTDADFNDNQTEVEQFLANDRQVMTTMTAQVVEETVSSPDGKQRYFQTIKIPIVSMDGYSQEILGVATDITERKQMEEQLRRSEAHLLEAQRIAHVGSWQFDMATQKIVWSAETFRMFGRILEQQEPTYEELLLSVHRDDRDYYQAIFQRAIEQIQPFELEHRVIRPDGATTHVLVRGQPILDEAGRLLSFLGTVLDITNRKQAEAQLRQTNEQLADTNMQLARATRLKDEFLANMSHELRTPLNAILGMTEGLQDQIFGSTNERQLKALQTIEQSGAHLLELIDDILDVAKIEAGQMELHCTPTAIVPLCQSSLAFVKQQALKKRIQIVTQLPSTLPDLFIDERRIRQVLLNLLNNAVKFTPNGGRITLEVSYQQPSINSEIAASSIQSFLRISISDTGIGIAAEHLNRLFQPFIQIDSALNRKYQGTGLGLALVKRIVELHGGRVGVSSEVGIGSCFTIDLPCKEAVLCATEPQVLSDTHAKNYPSQAAPLILLAEDNEANISTVSCYLEAKGCCLLIAKNGQETITIAQSQAPDLILLDIQMPGMDGLAVLQQIRCDPNLVDVPIIALTALAMPGDCDRCLAAGATDYLTKPFKLKQLSTLIQQLLRVQ